jgi:glutamate synthase domain-containing protein 2
MRREFFLISVPVLSLLALAGYAQWLSWGWFSVIAGLFLLGLYDVWQTKHTILRNFPVIGHLRFLLEMVRPEIQQYFVESDVTEDPISRIYRSVVYQRAKGDLQTVPFGSELDLYARDYEWVNHSCFPIHLDEWDFRVKIGGPQCSKPYNASLFNISAMSYGALSKTAVGALSRGAKAGGFYLNTGEGGLSPFHLEGGCDIVWQLGTAYFGARDANGYFDPVCFRERVHAHPEIKMIEIKISQGAKPGHGGILPGVKVDAEIAEIRRVPAGKTVISPPYHSAFKNEHELCQFIQKIRELSGGLPTGFKLCLGRREEFVKICEAMKETGIRPDFITIDGGEGGTGAAPFEFINYVGSPLKEALYFVHSTLEQHGVREDIRVIASGKVMTAFNLFEKLALGADLCNSARGMMLALGCIQAYRCNTNKCPTGIATNNPHLTSGLDVTDKSVRVANYHRKTMEAFCDLLGAAGLKTPQEISLKNISRRENNRIVNLSEIYESYAGLSPAEHAAKHKPRHEGERFPRQTPTHE